MQDPLDGPSWGDAEEPSGEPPVERPWRHPSEVGYVQRGRADRRRGALLAAGLVVAGVALLAAGTALGVVGPRDDGRRVATSSPRTAIEPSVAAVSVMGPAGRTTTTGLVLDDDGHVVVRADAVSEADEVWATCGDRPPQRARVLGVDAASGVAVLRVSEAAGRPVLGHSSPGAGTDVLAVRTSAGEGPLHVGWARVRPPGPGTDPAADIGVVAELADADGALFDQRGRFLGLVVEAAPAPAGEPGSAVVEARAVAAEAVLAAARRLAGGAGGAGGWIGVAGEAASGGVAVLDVVEGGPAHAAGMRAGDVVLSVDGDDVADLSELAEAVGALAPGTTVRVAVRRDAAIVQVDVVTAERPAR